MAVDGRGLQEGLGRDAPAVQTRPTDQPLDAVGMSPAVERSTKRPLDAVTPVSAIEPFVAFAAPLR